MTQAADILTAADLWGGYLEDADVLRGVSIVLREREIVSIIGPNGAGKSTLVKALFGLVRVRTGRVELEGTDVTGRRAHELVSLGMAYVPQRENVFPTLSVRENLEMGAVQRRSIMRRRMGEMYDLFPRLRERERQAAGTLSGGERQMVAFARALMTEPRVLLLDEPSAGLAPRVVGEVFDIVQKVRDRDGVSVLLVEQNARMALGISDRGYVLDMGQNAHEGPGSELANDPKVAQLYLGGAAATLAGAPKSEGPAEAGPNELG